MSQSRKEHALFYKYPLVSQREISVGAVPVPYHLYNGYLLFIGGTINLAEAKDLLYPEQVVPIETEDGQALAGIWVGDFSEASLGAHQELQFSVFVSHQPLPPVLAEPLIIYKLMLTNPHLRMLCHGLWNNTDTVVAYNREVLGLNAHLCHGMIETKPSAKKIKFGFTDVASGKLIFQGDVAKQNQPSFGTMLSLTRLLGLKETLRVAQLPWLETLSMNTVGELIPHNAEAQAYTKNDKDVVQLFDSSTDQLEFGNNIYNRLRFQPQFLQHMSGIRFVYLNMHNVGDKAYR